MRPIIERAIRAAMFFVLHAILACIVVAAVSGVDLFIRWLGQKSLGPGQELKLFDRVPLSYLFQAIDAALIVLFGGWGIVEAVKEFFSKDEPDKDK